VSQNEGPDLQLQSTSLLLVDCHDPLHLVHHLLVIPLPTQPLSEVAGFVLAIAGMFQGMYPLLLLLKITL
jgi:hypothetical protein